MVQVYTTRPGSGHDRSTHIIPSRRFGIFCFCFTVLSHLLLCGLLILLKSFSRILGLFIISSAFALTSCVILFFPLTFGLICVMLSTFDLMPCVWSKTMYILHNIIFWMEFAVFVVSILDYLWRGTRNALCSMSSLALRRDSVSLLLLVMNWSAILLVWHVLIRCWTGLPMLVLSLVTKPKELLAGF